MELGLHWASCLALLTTGVHVHDVTSTARCLCSSWRVIWRSAVFLGALLSVALLDPAAPLTTALLSDYGTWHDLLLSKFNTDLTRIKINKIMVMLCLTAGLAVRGGHA